MSYSNRVLSNSINRENVFALIYVDSGAGFEPLLPIRYKDIKAGSSFSESFDSTGEAEIIFSNEVLFKEILAVIDTKPTAFELILNDVSVYQNVFNKFYIPNISMDEFDALENIKTHSLKLVSFTDFYEKNTIAEHTVEYDFNSLPTDSETGEKIFPDDWNKVHFNSLSIENIINDLYLKNIVNSPNTNTVVNRIKGGFHSLDPNRGCFSMIFNGVFGILNQGNVTYTSEKKSVFEIREANYNTVRSRGNSTRHVLEIYHNKLDNKLNLQFVTRNPIVIEFDKTHDRFQYFRRERTRIGDIVDILVESDANDDISSRARIDIKNWQSKALEAILAGTIVEGDNASLGDKAKEIANANEVIDTTEIELFFKEKQYFKDIKAGQEIQINGYGPLVDGRYHVKKISGVVNGTYISYSLETLERID